eukprot:1697154-Amphidinium_carterae.2
MGVTRKNRRQQEQETQGTICCKRLYSTFQPRRTINSYTSSSYIEDTTMLGINQELQHLPIRHCQCIPQKNMTVQNDTTTLVQPPPECLNDEKVL